MVGDGCGGAGLHIAGWTQLQRNPSVADVGCESAQLRLVWIGHVDVVHDANPVPESIGPAPLDGLPNRRQTERLARVDGEVRVLASQVLERIQMARGRETSFSPCDIEADDPAIAVLHRKFRDFLGVRGCPHRCQQHSDPDPPAVSYRASGAFVEAVEYRIDHLSKGQSLLHVKFGSEADFGVDDAVCRKVFRAFARHPGESLGILRDCDRVLKRFQVPLQRSGVGGFGEPARQIGRVLTGKLAVARRLGQINDRLWPKPAIQMIVEQDFGGLGNRCRRQGAGHGRNVAAVAQRWGHPLARCITTTRRDGHPRGRRRGGRRRRIGPRSPCDSECAHRPA